MIRPQRGRQPPHLSSLEISEPQRPISNPNAVPSLPMPLADDPISNRRNPCDGIPNHRRPHRAVTEGHLTTLARDSRLNQCDSFPGRQIDPGNSSVTLIQNPNGTPANRKKPRPCAYRNLADNLIGGRIHP